MSETASTELVHIFPNLIHRNTDELTLRDVDTKSRKFELLVESIKTPRTDEMGTTIRDNGLINPIAVRVWPGEPGKYVIVDGLHRLTAWQQAFGNSKPIPCHVFRSSDYQTLLMQLEANVHTKPTRPAENARQIEKLMEFQPGISEDDIADKFHVDPQTVKSWLKLTKLPLDMQELIDNGEIPVSVGYTLSRFNPPTRATPDQRDECRAKQKEWLDKYQAMKGSEQALVDFNAQAWAAANALKKSFKGIATEGSDDIQPVARKATELKIELKRTNESLAEVDDAVVKETKDLQSSYPKVFEYVHSVGYNAALQWVLKVDEETVKERQERMSMVKEARERAQEERKAGKTSSTIARATGMFGKRRR